MARAVIAFDRAPFAGGVAPLKHDDYAQPLVYHPVLQAAQFGLQLAQLLLVFLTFHFGLRFLRRLHGPWISKLQAILL